MHKYNFDEDSIVMVMSYDGNYYICNMYDKALQNNRMPYQAVANKLFVEHLPKQFQDINRLERLLASRRIIFKKVTVKPKAGKSLKMKGTICNIPVIEVDVNCNTLPRPTDSNGLLIVKLKRKLEYESHVIFEAVRPALIAQFLEFLNLYNHLYSDIEINYNNIPVDMLGCHNEKLEESEIYLQLLRSLVEPVEVEVELSTNEEIYEDPLSNFRAPSAETTIISQVPSNCNCELEQEITITPGKGKQPISVLNDKFCEELAHQHLFPSDNMAIKYKEKYHYVQVNILIKDYCIIVKSLLQIVTIYSLNSQYYRKFSLVVR